MLTRLLWTGTAGSALVAISSWWVGAVPNSFQTDRPPGIDWLPIGGALPRAVYYIGLSTLVLSWVILGRTILTASAPAGRRRLAAIAIAWMVPLLAAMPVGSRDLWAYAAQGNLSAHGLSPYTHGPNALAGVFAANVSPRWIDATSPYGPLWLLIGRVVAFICGEHVQLSVFVLRLPAFAGALLVLWALPRLARVAGARADLAVWLAVLNPFVLVLGLAGGHNDLAMTGLMVAGALCAAAPGGLLRTLVLGAAVMAAAAAIKSPAAIGAIFLVPIWLRFHPPADESRWRRVAVAVAAAAAGSLAAFAVISAVSGYGLGWVKQVNSSAPVVNWLSLPTAAAMVANLSDGTVEGATRLDTAMEHWRTGGLVLAGLLIAAGWVMTTAAEGGFTRRRIEPLIALAVALFAIIVLGPAVQPWYFSWLLPFAACGRFGRRGVAVAVGVCVSFVLMIRPLGTGVEMKPVIAAVIALGALAGWAMGRSTGQRPLTRRS